MNSRSLAAVPPTDIAAWRKAERARLLALREAVPLERQRRDDERIAQLLMLGFPLLRELAIGFYWPFKGEVDPRVAVHRLRTLGARSALPVVIAKGAPLEFRYWTPDTRTEPGVFGLPVPQGTETVVPDAVLMPPVGFDSHGYRLGYGGGFFDRTLAAISPQPLKIGLARELGRIETIHPQPHDIPMDFIVTENGIHEVSAAGLRLLPELEEAARIAERIRATRHAMSIEELAELLNTLLEAERAGAKVLSAFLDQLELGQRERSELHRIQRDESRNCAILIDLLQHLGRPRSEATGDFLERALALQGARPRLEFLNRGQAWVARRIAAALPRIGDARVRAAMQAMHDSHLANIGACEALIPGEIPGTS